MTDRNAAPAASDGSIRALVLVMLAACTMLMVSYGIRTSFGLFLQPVSATLGWGRETFALALAMQNLLWGLAQPFSGAIADRHGSGWVLGGGALLYAAGLFFMSVTTEPGMAYLSIGVLVGLGMSGMGFASVQSAIGKAAPDKWRPLALGIGGAAGSFGQVVVTPFGNELIQSYGWETTLTIFAVMMALIAPLALTVRKARPGTGLGPAQSLGQALTEARRHRGYRLLVMGFFVCGFHVVFIGTHLPAYILEMGVSPAFGGYALAAIGASNIVGSLLAGALGGRFSKKYLLSFLYTARASAISLFVLLPPSEYTVMGFAFVIGLLWLSTVPLTAALVGQIFGPRYMATLFGIVFLSHQCGAALGAWLGGYVFDLVGSYATVWWIAVGLGLVSAALHFPIDERPVERPVARDPATPAQA